LPQPHTIQRSKEVIQGSHMMRDGALEQLDDDDLLFSPGGENPTLGDLIKQLGDLQHSYTQSLKTFQHDWSYRNKTNRLAQDLALLKQWFADLDADMTQTLDDLSDDDLEKEVDRGNDVIRTVDQQLEIYSQATLIFFGKLVVYFRAMEKSLPPSIAHYIG